MSRQVEQAVAVVLRAVDYGESDRIVTLLTRELGAVSAMARAARKSKKRFAGALEGFAVVQVELVAGKGALSRLETARVVRVFPRLLVNLAGLEAAGALSRLARELLPERAPEPDVFDCLVEAFELLDEGVGPSALRLSCEARILARTGFAPSFAACVGCGREPLARQAAFFDVVRGGIVCRACGGGPERLSGALREALSEAVEGAPLDALGGVLSDADVGQGARLLSLFVAQLLEREHKLDKRH